MRVPYLHSGIIFYLIKCRNNSAALLSHPNLDMNKPDSVSDDQ